MREHYRMKPGQQVYFAKPIGMDGPIKIGCSSEPPRRLLSLMSWCPFPLELLVTIPGGYQLERDLHDCFAEAYRHNEWFEPVPELLEAIDLLKAGAPIEKVVNIGSCRGALSAVRRKRGRTPWSNLRRLKLSYSSRISWANRKLSRGKMMVPQDVYEILGRWSRRGDGTASPPLETELARLDEVIANPEKHAVPRPTWGAA